MEIREFREEDRRTLEALMDDFQVELVALDPRRRLLRRPGYGTFFVRAMLEDADAHEGLVLVAEEAGRLVGFAASAIRLPNEGDELSMIPYRSGRVIELYVEPGSRLSGTGAALVRRLEEHVRDSGCGAMRIEVFAPNAGARAFYDALGYEERDIDLFKPLGLSDPG